MLVVKYRAPGIATDPGAKTCRPWQNPQASHLQERTSTTKPIARAGGGRDGHVRLFWRNHSSLKSTRLNCKAAVLFVRSIRVLMNRTIFVSWLAASIKRGARPLIFECNNHLLLGD